MSFFQCFVKFDKTIAYNTHDLGSTVGDLKNFVWDRFDIHPSKQILKYACKSLKDEMVLKDIIQQDGNVNVLLRHTANVNNNNTDTYVQNSNNSSINSNH
jgi:hypothetical protein